MTVEVYKCLQFHQETQPYWMQIWPGWSGSFHTSAGLPSLEWPFRFSENAWGHKLHQSTSKWISYTVLCEVLCLIPKSEVLPAETLNFAPQVGWRHHQVRKEISCRKWPRRVTRLTRFWPAVCEGLGRSRKRWVAPVAPAYPYERRRTLMMTCTVSAWSRSTNLLIIWS